MGTDLFAGVLCKLHWVAPHESWISRNCQVCRLGFHLAQCMRFICGVRGGWGGTHPPLQARIHADMLAHTDLREHKHTNKSTENFNQLVRQ